MSSTYRSLTQAERECISEELAAYSAKTAELGEVIAAKIGCSHAYFYKAKTGSACVGVEFAAKVARLVGKPLRELLGEDVVTQYEKRVAIEGPALGKRRARAHLSVVPPSTQSSSEPLPAASPPRAAHPGPAADSPPTARELSLLRENRKLRDYIIQHLVFGRVAAAGRA